MVPGPGGGGAVLLAGARPGRAVAGGRAGAIEKRPVLVAFSWAIYALVVAAVLLGVLFVARDFIAAKTGWYLLGATQIHPAPEVTG